MVKSSTVMGAQTAKLRRPKVEVRQGRTCKSPRAAERKCRRLVLAATELSINVSIG